MAHIHEAIDFTVGALIVHDGKVLLVDHREVGQWLPPGGHVELDEDTDQALFREIEEETGLGERDIEVFAERPGFSAQGTKSLLRPQWVNIHVINPSHRHIGLAFVVRAKSSAVRLEAKAHHEIRWFTVEELDDRSLRIPEDVRWYGKEAIQILTK